MTCKIINRALNGKFLAKGAADPEILARCAHAAEVARRRQERREAARARREAMNDAPLSHNPFASLLGGK